MDYYCNPQYNVCEWILISPHSLAFLLMDVRILCNICKSDELKLHLWDCKYYDYNYL
jgi:hypothetical protein